MPFKPVVALLSCSAAALFAAKSAAFTDQDAAELAGLVADFRAGEQIDTDRFVALSDQAAETGLIPFGIFEGALRPIGEPVVMIAPPVVTLNCEAEVASTQPIPGNLPEYTETIVISRSSDGTGSLDYTTTDVESTVSMQMSWDERGRQVERVAMTDQFGDMVIIPTPDGGWMDEVTGEVFAPNALETQMLGSVSDVIVSGNPSLFLNETTVAAGAEWLDPDAKTGFEDSIEAAVSSGMIGAEADVETVFLHSAFSGVSDTENGPGLVLEYLFEFDISVGFGVSAQVRGIAHEIHDVASLSRVAWAAEMRFEAPGVDLVLTQTQRCAVAE